MPHELLWEKDGVHKRFWGDLSGRELADSVERVAAHPRFGEISFILNDFLEVGDHTFDGDSMERILISRLGSRYTNPRIRVMLVTTNESLFALADVTKPGSFPATNETKGFSSMDEARAWFSRQPPLVQTAYRAV